LIKKAFDNFVFPVFYSGIHHRKVMRTYTKREIAHLLKVSPRTVADDAKFLNLNPTQSDRGLKLFSQADFNLLTQMRQHCSDKANSRESFLANTDVEVLDIEPTVSKYQKISAPSIFESAIDFGLSQDPLFDLELLQRISDNQWLLPSKRLAPLFGISTKHLNLQKDYCYCGFIASRETYAMGKILWKVTANNS
jgi:hypothetical protein